MEELAVKYVICGPYQLFFYCILPLAAGAFAAIFMPKPELRLTRGTYVFAYGLVSLVHSLSYFPWAHSAEAIVAGRAWILMLDSVGSSFALGIVIALLAVARSYDAYGHAEGAILAFIPIGNFFLFYARSKDKRNSTMSPWLMRGFVGVVLGISLNYAGGAVFKYTFTARINSIVGSKNLPIDIYDQFVKNNTGP